MIDWLRAWLRGVWQALPWALGVIVIAVVAEKVQFLKDLDTAVNQSRDLALRLAIGITFTGFTAFMAGVIYGASISGGEFHVKLSFREIKQAWRVRAWWGDPSWRFNFFMITAATVMALGMFGLFFVLGTATVKVLVISGFLYIFMRTAWAFLLA